MQVSYLLFFSSEHNWFIYFSNLKWKLIIKKIVLRESGLKKLLIINIKVKQIIILKGTVNFFIMTLK